MSKKIIVERQSDACAHIEQLSPHRGWMDQTSSKHAYQCFPLSITNSLGWSISFPEDLVFSWDGVWDSSSDHVKIISGERYLHAGRGHATISFNTGLKFKTDEDTTILTMPVPNQFNPYAQCFTTLISTSFFRSALPIAWTITQPNIEIVIPAGKPIATIIPISLNDIQDYEVEVIDHQISTLEQEELNKYSEKLNEVIMSGKWSRFYKNATDSDGKTIGKHETKTINLKTKYSY